MGIRSATVDEVRSVRADRATGDETDGCQGDAPRRGSGANRVEDPVVDGRAPTAAAVGDDADSRTVVPPTRAVFVDSTGKRSRTWRRAGAVTALCCTCYATTVVAALIGGDSSAPFFQLPRALGLEREAGERPAESRDASPTESALGTPGPVTPDQERLSAAARPTVQRPIEASFDPADIPTVDAAPTPGPRTSDGAAQTGGGGGELPGEPSVPAPAPET
ncbi:hypothetical protein ABT105_12910, partial [Streptomyces sp. NPDC001876]